MWCLLASAMVSGGGSINDILGTTSAITELLPTFYTEINNETTNCIRI